MGSGALFTSGSDRDVVVVAGVRTPFVKAHTQLGRIHPVELGRIAVREAIERADVDPAELDEVIVGNIGSPADAANIARVVSLMAKVPRQVPAFTVNRNCASGIESIVEAAYRIRSGDQTSWIAWADADRLVLPGDKLPRMEIDLPVTSSNVMVEFMISRSNQIHATRKLLTAGQGIVTISLTPYPMFIGTKY